MQAFWIKTEPEVTTVTTSDAENELPVTTNEDGIYRADVLVRDVKKVEDGVFEVTAKMYGKDNVKFTCTDASIEEMFTGEYFIANIEGNYDDKTITSIEKTAAYEVSEKEGYVVKVTAEDGGFGIALGENMETEELQYVFVPEDTFNELGITVGTKVSVSLSNYYSNLEAIEVLEQPETTTTTETEPTETTTEDTEITTTETTTTTAIFTETQPTETSNTEVTKPSDIVEVADVNGDGKVNIIDLMQIAQYIVGVEGASGADVNGDGKANILDLMLVAQYIVGADADSTTTTTTTTTTFATTESETLPTIETIPTTQISCEPEDEWGFVAMHFVNAQYGKENTNVKKIITFVRDVNNFILNELDIKPDKDSLFYHRYMTHLNFFAQRVAGGVHYSDDNDIELSLLKKHYREEYKVSCDVANYIKKNYHFKPNKDEIMYLTIHLAHITRHAV